VNGKLSSLASLEASADAPRVADEPQPTSAPHGLRLAAATLLLSLLGWALWSYLDGGIVSRLISSDLSSTDKVEAVQEFFLAWGNLAPVVYVAVVTVEVVVAPIPGMMLYLPGGLIFGGFWGGVLSLLSNILGAGIACILMRTLAGRQATRSFFAKQSLEKYRHYLEQHGMAILVLLRVNPFTSSDLVSYAAGLTPIPVWKVMLGTGVGMLPICFAQSYLAQEIFTALPWLIGPLILLCLVYVVVFCVVVARLRRTVNEPR